jgi:hypothetical protein
LNDISKDRNYIAYLESGGTKVSDLVKKLAFENADLQSQIDEYELELQSLRIALLDEDLPPEDKKKKFMDVYNAKGNDK